MLSPYPVLSGEGEVGSQVHPTLSASASLGKKVLFHLVLSSVLEVNKRSLFTARLVVQGEHASENREH